jgi:hypothetical protein
LLIADSFVGGEQKVEACGLSFFEQFAVRNPVLAAFYRLGNIVARKRVDSLLNFKSFFFLEGCGKPLSF